MNRTVKILLCGLVLLVLFGGHQPLLLAASPLGFSGNWQYSDQSGDVETPWSFNEFYNLDFTKDLTEAMYFSGSARYNNNRRGGGERYSLFTPTLSLDVRNDLFFLNLSAVETWQNASTAADKVNQAWDVNLFTQNRDWPRFRFNYGQSRSYDDQIPREVNQESSYFGGRADYTWSTVRLLYDYRMVSNEDFTTRTTYDNSRHFGQIQASKDFFDGRLSVSGAYQVSYDQTDVITRVGVGGEIYIPISRFTLEAYSGDDDTPMEGALPTNDLLIDGNTVDSAGAEIGQAGVVQNLALLMSFQPFNRMKIYLDKEIALSTQSLISWSFYTSDNGVNWFPMTQSPSISYELENARSVAVFDIPAPLVEVRYFKAVAERTAVISESVFVTELEVGAVRLATSDVEKIKSNFLDRKSTFSVAYSPSGQWRFNYNLRHTLREPDPGRDSTELSQSVAAGYTLNRYLSTLFGINQTDKKNDGESRRTGRAYSLSLTSSPLDSLEASAGYTHTDNYFGSLKETLQDSVNGYMSAVIFPDLTARISMNWDRNQNEIASFTTTTTTWRFDSTARMSPKFTVDITYNRTSTQNDGLIVGSEGLDSSTYGAKLNYRPSDLLLILSQFDYEEYSGDTSIAGSVSLRATPKIQTTANFNLGWEETDFQAYDLQIFWSLSQYISLRALCGYLLEDGVNSWSTSGSLSANF